MYIKIEVHKMMLSELKAPVNELKKQILETWGRL
ncbi:MAG: hypothetical protein Ta2B_24120 [Termitinemataceae bacterium]|nr:MAG: hypothetical protein Ta2B_24120 [Termitinemataceae bacterium]